MQCIGEMCTSAIATGVQAVPSMFLGYAAGQVALDAISNRSRLQDLEKTLDDALHYYATVNGYVAQLQRHSFQVCSLGALESTLRDAEYRLASIATDNSLAIATRAANPDAYRLEVESTMARINALVNLVQAEASLAQMEMLEAMRETDAVKRAHKLESLKSKLVCAVRPASRIKRDKQVREKVLEDIDAMERERYKQVGDMSSKARQAVLMHIGKS